MSVLVALLRVVFGFVAAVLAAGVVQVLFVAGLDGVLDSGAGPNVARLQSLGLLALLAATQSAVFAAPFAFLAAAVAAWLPLRSVFFFIAAGLATALAGFFAQYAGEAGPQTILNRYALAAYVTSGFIGGVVYWLVAVEKSRKSKADPS